jgi:hypothetical protein
VIEKLTRKLLGIGLVMAGVCLIPGVWALLAELISEVGQQAPRGPKLLGGLFGSAFIVTLIIIGGRLIVPPLGKPEWAAKSKKPSEFDEFV